MIEPYLSPKAMKQSTLTGDVFVFRSNAVRDIVTGLNDIINSNDLCQKLELQDTQLYIPVLVPAIVINGVITMLDTFTKDRDCITPMLSNYLKTEVFDGTPGAVSGDVDAETLAQTLGACRLLVNALIAELEATESIQEGQYGYELLKLASSGALFVCRFSLDC